MVGTNYNGVASASIVCDPSNYDWVDDDPSSTGDQDAKSPNTNQLETHPDSDRGNLNVVTEEPSSDALLREQVHAAFKHKTTDKEVSDFIFGETANQTLMRLSNQFAPIVEEGADTLIHIGPPPKARGQTDLEYDCVRRAFQRPYLLRSDTLRKLGSAKFNELLGPKSKRTQRKLQKAGIHKLLLEPDKIKYFIDLTPDIHDDEGMVLLLELSAPPGVRSWHKDAKRFNIRSSHVCGRDALDMLPKPLHRLRSREGPEVEDQDGAKVSDYSKVNDGKTNPDKKSAREDSDTSGDEKTSLQDNKAKSKEDEPYDQPEEDDYSQLRHHTGIVRLLHAITGQDPKLNSASKAWTFCMLAKFFDCAKNEIVNACIIDWLLQSANINFIQVNPSIAYRLGVAMGSIWLVRSSFCIMVGLRAFEQVKTSTDAAVYSQGNAMLNVPPASRITDGLDDDDIDRVDHAAMAFVKRINGQLRRLLAEGGEWKSCLAAGSQMAKLYQLDPADPETKGAHDEVKRSLDHYVRRLLCGPLVDFDDTNATKGNVFKPPMNITSYHLIPALLRPLTLQFWETMRSQDLAVDPSFSTHLSHWTRWEYTLRSLIGEGALAPENANIPFISKSCLNLAVDLLNSLQEDRPWLASPKKKVKLSPPPKHGNQSAFSAVEDDPFSAKSRAPTRNTDSTAWGRDEESDLEYRNTRFTIGDFAVGKKEPSFAEHVRPAQPSTFLVPLPIRHVDEVESIMYTGPDRTDDVDDQEKTPLLKQDSRQSYVELTQNGDGEESGNDDWEDVLGDLEAQTKVNQPDHVFGVHGLPLRSKPMTSQVTASQASGEFSRSHLQGNNPSTQDDYSQVDNDVNANLHQPVTEPVSVSYSHVAKYGNPSRPQPVNSPDDVVSSNELSNRLQKAIDQDRTAPSFSSRTSKSKLRVVNPDLDEQNFNSRFSMPRIPSPPRFETNESPLFADLLLNQINSQVRYFVTPILLPGFMADNSCGYDIPLNEIGTLTSLTDEEYKYLPLWAGGNDDGSGGVFDDGEDIPEAPEVEFGGFRGGAMGIIPGVGSTIGGSIAGSEFEEISTEVGVSTVGKASRIATDGADTVMSLDE